MKIVSGLLMKLMLINISRVILALYFLLPGISKFMYWNMHIELMETHNMIMAPLFLAITGAAQVVGSIFLIFNRWVIEWSLVFAAMVIVCLLYTSPSPRDPT